MAESVGKTGFLLSGSESVPAGCVVRVQPLSSPNPGPGCPAHHLNIPPRDLENVCCRSHLRICSQALLMGFEKTPQSRPGPRCIQTHLSLPCPFPSKWCPAWLLDNHYGVTSFFSCGFCFCFFVRLGPHSLLSLPPSCAQFIPNPPLAAISKPH